MQLIRPNAMGGHWFYYFSFPTRTNTTMDNIIMISDLHASQAKANIYVANEINHM